MDALAQRIASAQQRDQTFGEGLNHRDLERKARVLDGGGERPALAQQRAGAPRELLDEDDEARAGAICAGNARPAGSLSLPRVVASSRSIIASFSAVASRGWSAMSSAVRTNS